MNSKQLAKCGEKIVKMHVNEEWYYNINYCLKVMKLWNIRLSKLDQFKRICITKYIQSIKNN